MKHHEDHRVLLSLAIIAVLILASVIPHVIEVKGEEKHKLVWKKNLGADVKGVCWGPDGEQLVTVGDFEKVIVFDREGNIVWEDKPGDYTYLPSISSSGEFLLVNVGDHGLYFYDLESGKVIYKTGTDYTIWSTCWSSDNGGYIAVGCDKGYLYLYRWLGAAAKIEWKKKIAEDSILSVCFSPVREDKIALGSKDYYVYLVNLDGEVLWERDLDNRVKGVYFSPRGDYIAAVTEGGSLYILRAGDGKIIAQDKPTTEGLKSVIWYDKYIITGDVAGTVYVYLWENNKLEPVYAFKAAQEEICWHCGLSFNPKYGYLAVASYDNYVYVYDISGVVKATTTTPTTVSIITVTTTKTTTTTITTTTTTTYTTRGTTTITKTLTKTETQTETRTQTKILTKTTTSTVTLPGVTETKTLTLRETLTLTKPVTVKETMIKPYTIMVTREVTLTKQVPVIVRSIVTNVVENPSKVSNEAIILSVLFIAIGLVISLVRRRRG